MNFSKIVVFLFLFLCIESNQSAMHGVLIRAARSQITKQSESLCAQQIRTIRRKPLSKVKRKNIAAQDLEKIKPQLLEHDQTNFFGGMNWLDVKHVVAKSKHATIAFYEKAQNVVAHKTRELQSMVANDIFENKVITKAAHTADEMIIQAAKTDAAQAASGFLNRNATTNNVTHTTNNYYAQETLAQTLMEKS